MGREMTILLILTLIGVWGIVGGFSTPATAQMYAQCCENGASDLDQFEWATGEAGPMWSIEGNTLIVSDINFTFNVFVIKNSIWQDLGAPTDFTVEVKAVEFVFGNKDNVGWWYVMLRYGQDPVSAERKNMFMWTFDEEGGNNGLYMYEFTPGLKAKWPNHGDDARIRYTAAQVAGAGLGEEFVSHTRVGEWINDPGVIGEEYFHPVVEVTATSINAWMNDEVELENYPNDSNPGGRPGLATWSDGGAIHFRDFMVYGPDGPTAVDPADKVSTTWGTIKSSL